MITGSYVLGTDIWAGQSSVNEYAVKPASPLQIIRLNSISGGHHLDSGFTTYWEEAQYAAFLRSIYFVYNAWVDGKTNAVWLLANMPKDTPKRIFIDVEVAPAGYSPTTFGAELQKFCDLITTAGYIPTMYTGAWFLDKVSPWPKNLDYWWAQYPLSLYPNVVTHLTWEALESLITPLSWPPTNASQCPGTIKLWQCSGDRLVLPGFTTAVDISVWNGDYQSLVNWIQPQISTVPIPDPAPTPVPIPVTPATGLNFKVDIAKLNVRSGPATTYPVVDTVSLGDIEPALYLAGNDAWIMIGVNRWICIKQGATVYAELVK
jgi:GH25 family lysozyme M1 (1,4-beta-N-acetylmuramidase)